MENGNQVFNVFSITQNNLADPFRKVNKYVVRKMLGEVEETIPYRKLKYSKNGVGVSSAIILHKIGKMKSKFKKLKTFNQDNFLLNEDDVYIKEISCLEGYEDQLKLLIKENLSIEGRTIVEVNMELKSQIKLMESLGFGIVQNKISSFGDVYGVYSYPNYGLPSLNNLDKVSITELKVEQFDIEGLVKEVENISTDYTNHYSNYNKNKSWSGLSLRGFGGDESFIIKPTEMNKKWKKTHKVKLGYKIKNTNLTSYAPGYEKVLQVIPSNGFERVRLLKLESGGELERHTDIQDKDLGLLKGQIVRLHIPLITNKDTYFEVWECDGSITKMRMEKGHLYYLDIRKPHRAVNNGDKDRIHLVIDIIVNDDFRLLLQKSINEN